MGGCGGGQVSVWIEGRMLSGVGVRKGRRGMWSSCWWWWFGVVVLDELLY